MDLSRYLSYSGEIVTPKDNSYESSRQIWNRAVQKYPLAILYCLSKEDVSSAIQFCVRKKVQFRIRSGGHSYEGFCVDNNVAVIDVSRLKKIKINYYDNTIEVGAGINNSELYEFLADKGYPFPGGTCPTVGVIGYALGGGWGYSCRLFGLGCDNLLELEMIDYKGNCITANNECNRELFWALRGAGNGNFGVVTSAKFKLPPKFNNVTLFSIYYPDCTFIEQANIMDIFQNAYQTLDRRVNIRASFYHNKTEGVAVYLMGIFYGLEEELAYILDPFLRIPNAEANFEYTTFNEAIRQIESTYPKYEKFKSSSGFSNKIYSREELLTLANSLQRIPEGSVYAAITFYGLGGEVKRLGSNDTAYYYRNSNFLMGVQSVWEDDRFEEENKKWVASRLRYIKSITEGIYVNFPYRPLKNYEKEYYGENIYRLMKIKAKYDPYNIFNYEQSIRPY